MGMSNEYAYALFMLTEELGTTDSSSKDTEAIAKILSDTPDYVKLLDTPAISKDEKLGLIDKAFQGFDENVVNLLKILCERHSVSSFCSIKKAYKALYDESRGIEHAEVITARPLTDEQFSRLTDKLSALTGKTVILHPKTDNGILGGIKLRYCGKQLDASVKTRLDNFEKSLKNTII